MLGEGNAPVARWSPDGQRVLVEGINSSPIIFDAHGLKVALLRGTHGQWIGNESLLVATDQGVFAESLDGPVRKAPADLHDGAIASATGAIAYPVMTSDTTWSFRVWNGTTTTSARPGYPVAWSPDGSILVLWQPTGPLAGQWTPGYPRLLAWPSLRTIRNLTSTPTSDQQPQFDPSGTHLAFISGARVQILDLATGRVLPVSEVDTGSDAFAWSSHGNLYYSDAAGTIVSVTASGTDRTALGHGDTVTASPDGSVVAFYDAQSAEHPTVNVLDLRSNSVRTFEAPGVIEPTVSVAFGGQALTVVSAGDGQDMAVILYRIGH